MLVSGMGRIRLHVILCRVCVRWTAVDSYLWCFQLVSWFVTSSSPLLFYCLGYELEYVEPS